MTGEPDSRAGATPGPSRIRIRGSDKLRRQLFVERLFFLAVIALLVFIIVRHGRALTAYQIMVDGRPVAMVSEEATAEKLLAELRGDVPGARFRQRTDVVRVDPRAPAVVSEEEARAALAEALKVVVPAHVIFAEGRMLAAVSSREEAEQVLSRMRASYAGPKQQAHFKEAVRIEEAEVTRTKLLSPDEAFRALAGDAAARPGYTYHVKSGDTAWAIAQAHGLTVEHLASLNPGVDINRLQRGQALTVARAKPRLTVVTVEECTELKMVPAPTRVRVTADLPAGQRRVASSGQDGQKTVRYRITRENGREVKRQVIGETIMRAPEPKIVLVGQRAE